MDWLWTAVVGLSIVLATAMVSIWHLKNRISQLEQHVEFLTQQQAQLTNQMGDKWHRNQLMR